MESPHLDKVNLQARQVLYENDWQWDACSLGFRRPARPRESTGTYKLRQRRQPCPDLITIEELESHNLYFELQGAPIRQQIGEGLVWLRRRIEEAEPK